MTLFSRLRLPSQRLCFMTVLAAGRMFLAHATAVAPASFDAPLQFTSGGRSVVKALGTIAIPENDVDQNDNGFDFTAPLSLNGDGGAYDVDSLTRAIERWGPPRQRSAR